MKGVIFISLKKIYKYALLICIATFSHSKSYASNIDDNPIISTNQASINNGSSYWQSSNIREWLNSDKYRVNYSSNIPSKDNLGIYSYDKEPGFLTNFTEEELDAIAVTKRRVFVSNSQFPDVKGSVSPKLHYNNKATNNSFGDIINNWKKYSYQIVLDKVFYLNTAEYFYYLESRGFEKPKKLRDDAKLKYNYTSNTVNWDLTHTYVSGKNTDSLWRVFSNTDNILRVTSPSVSGVVPALHIKPDFIFENGEIAKNISIGNEVEFGIYNNTPIVWDVINKTKDGYILLLSKEAIDLKHYNSKGDATIYKYSKYINFDTYDVDISDDLQVGALRNNDIELPTLTILNEDKLLERQLTSFDLEIQASDNDSVEYVILPNNNKIYNPNLLTYTISENKDYYFEIKDVNGNVRQYLFPIYNINTPSKVDISSSSEGWTNKDVKVSISSTNSKIGSYTEETITSKRDTFLNQWSNYDSYKGRPMRITGSVELHSHNLDLGNVSTGLGLYYNKMSKTKSGDFILNKAIYYPQRWRLDYLKENGRQDFDITFNIPNDVNDYFHPFFQTETEEANAYYIKWTNVRFELLDQDSFGIEKIVLPNGEEIFNNSYTDTITEEGSYIYQVYDSNGVITEKQIDVFIDKKPPTINFTYDNNIPSGSPSILKVEASDDRSGIKKILLPNGEEFLGSSIDYNVTMNQNLTFKAYDNAGNVATKSISITNIDNEVTDIIITKNPNDTASRTVEIVITSNDPAGTNYIELPDGNRINSNTASYIATCNGEYRFLVCDGAGNKEYFFVDIENIDDTKPTVNIDKDSNWTNQGVQININTRD